MTRLKELSGPRPARRVETLDELYRRYADWLRARLGRRFDPIIAEDLVQDTYIRMTAVDPSEIRHPKALLMRTAVNLGLNQVRRRARRGDIVEILSEQDAADIELAQPPAQDATLRLKEIVLGLPPLYRDVFLLRRFEGLTHAQISARLGIAEKTVERRMAKALALCAAQLQD